MNVKNILSNVLIFAVGAAIGSAVTWHVAKTKYEQLINDEIKSVKEHYSKKFKDLKDKEESGDAEEFDEIDDADLDDYDQILKDNDYNQHANTKEAKIMERPRVIPPEEFGETDYETVSLTYYADRVLADDFDEPVENVDEIIGLESLTTFGDYENDSVFVRNDKLKRDYEILKDTRKYSDVIQRVYPYKTGD